MEYRYTEDHEWILRDGDEYRIGITQHAANELGEIVFVECQPLGTELSQGDEFGSVESVKTVSGLYSPISGTIVDINDEVINYPDQINSLAETGAWLIQIQPSNLEEIDELMSESEYKQFLNE